jgi:hypothetical protein
MRNLRVVLLAALLLALVAPAHAQERVADLELRLWPSPSTASRGDTVRYDLTVTNHGDGKAGRTRVTVPFAKGQLAFVKVELAQKSSWVMELAEDKIVIMFGTLRTGEQREARIFLTVAKDAPDGGAIRVRATARYDEEGDTRVRSNETILRVAGAAADTAPGVAVEPAAGPQGTVFRFSARNYFPEEQIFTWINAAGGVIPSKLAARATEQGEAVLDLESAKLELAPGRYSLVVYGESSKATVVVPFEIR